MNVETSKIWNIIDTIYDSINYHSHVQIHMCIDI